MGATASGAAGFHMQMVLVLVAGYMMASTPLVKRILAALAGLARFARFASSRYRRGLGCKLDQLGFGLVVSALFAKQLARSVRVDYRLLVASAYSAL